MVRGFKPVKAKGCGRDFGNAVFVERHEHQLARISIRRHLGNQCQEQAGIAIFECIPCGQQVHCRNKTKNVKSGRVVNSKLLRARHFGAARKVKVRSKGCQREAKRQAKSKNPAQQVAERTFGMAWVSDDHGVEQPFAKGRGSREG